MFYNLNIENLMREREREINRKAKEEGRVGLWDQTKQDNQFTTIT